MLARKLLETIPFSIRKLRKLTVSVLEGPLTFHQTRVLFLIKEGLGQTQIAENLQVTPAAISRLMHQLCDKGLLSMCPGSDRRERKLSLTDEGQKILTAVSRQVEKKLNKGLSQLTSTEKDDLNKGLTVLHKLMTLIEEGKL